MSSLKSYIKSTNCDISDFTESVVCVAPFYPVHRGYIPYIEKINNIFENTNRYELVVVPLINDRTSSFSISAPELVDNIVLNIPHVNKIVESSNLMDMCIKLMESKIYPERIIINKKQKKSLEICIEQTYGKYYSDKIIIENIQSSVSVGGLTSKGITDQYIIESVTNNNYGQFKSSLINENDEQAIKLFINLRNRITNN